MKALNRGYAVTSILAIIGFFIASRWLLGPDHYFNFFLCGMIGVLTAFAFVFITQYYTEYRYRPVKSIAEASQTGPATNIIAGLAVGMESTGYPVLVIGAAIVSAYLLGDNSGLQHAGLFGTAVATMGMLATAAYILAMDTFGPITDHQGRGALCHPTALLRLPQTPGLGPDQAGLFRVGLRVHGRGPGRLLGEGGEGSGHRGFSAVEYLRG